MTHEEIESRVTSPMSKLSGDQEKGGEEDDPCGVPTAGRRVGVRYAYPKREHYERDKFLFGSRASGFGNRNGGRKRRRSWRELRLDTERLRG